MNRPDQLRSHLAARARQRPDRGGADRSHHPPGVLCRLAERRDGKHGRQGSLPRRSDGKQTAPLPARRRDPFAPRARRADQASMRGPLSIQEQGSFAVGGRTLTDADGKNLPRRPCLCLLPGAEGARKLPLVFWHGAGQSAKTWETTPDGREGFQNLFLRRGFSVYLVDQPRRGRAGRSTSARHDHPGAGRADLVQHLPPRDLAELLPRRAVLRATRRRWTSTSAR